MGSTLLHQNGRGVTPTATGELFLGYGLRILALSKEAHARLHPPDLEGVVRIGSEVRMPGFKPGSEALHPEGTLTWRLAGRTWPRSTAPPFPGSRR